MGTRPVVLSLGLALLVDPASAASQDGSDASARKNEPATVERPSAQASTASGAGGPHYMDAALAELGILALGTGWYWAYRGDNANDWDDPDLEARLSGEAWRMDNNGLAMNFLAHALSGSGFYAVARANGVGLWGSAGYSFGTSFIWEYVIEFREKVSINDVITTPGAGITIGEFFHKLALYVNSPTSEPSALRNILRYTIGPSVALRRLADDDRSLGAPPSDSLGYSAQIYHDFRFNYGYASVTTPDLSEFGRHQLGYYGKLVTIPGYRTSTTFAKTFDQGDQAEFELSVDWSEQGRGFGLFADTLLFGYHAQSFSGHGLERSGAGATIGASLAYQFLDTHASGVPERIGVLHLPGPGADVFGEWNGFHFELGARAHADFAGVGSLAYPIWEAEHPSERPKAILLKKGYYYALGGSARLEGSLGWGPFSLQGKAEVGYYDSIENLDRDKTIVTADVRGEDLIRRLSADFVLSPAPWFSLSAGTSRRRQVSRVEDVREVGQIEEWRLAVGVGF